MCKEVSYLFSWLEVRASKGLMDMTWKQVITAVPMPASKLLILTLRFPHRAYTRPLSVILGKDFYLTQ